MHSFSGFVKLLKSSSSLKCAQLLTIVVVTMLAGVALYFSQLMVYTAPDASRLMVIEGRVSGYPDSWEHNRSLVHFGVAYKLDGKREGKPIYTYRELYEASRLRINSKVVLTVERVDEGSRVRELATLDGRILYDDRLGQQVVLWNNESIRSTVILGCLASIGTAVAAVVMLARHQRGIGLQG
ncbi:hypothetical protein [Pseudomonas sp. KCJK9111]|uniref:hypothetical protein n=1 Tax=Pseudomonas sp. KCJK9111 TaxID=3344555 RepID=UPI00390606B0